MKKRDMNKQGKPFALAVSLLIIPGIALSQSPGHQHASPYAGEQSRAIKSLSRDDIDQLQRGAGWGLARAAELNGVPGPAHLLELQDDIPLAAHQVAEIRDIFERMQADTIAEGQRLIALEERLDVHFREGTITDDILQRLLADIAESRGRLRYLHLATHLETPRLLTDAQIERYNELRGYRRD